ncbi:hypothetical protein POWCR01_000224400 [Plasmodium ovale]|uniref:PIR protein n=1 Tax=Plasmodium ovale TaxID=36330 RepID=A0A1C3KKV0_PLAOA|nr:hypothetical protein POWCR01_000224400 [Plasmodium ovale]
MQSNYNVFARESGLQGKIYQIEVNNFDSMYTLYELYRIYTKLKTYDKAKCQEFHEKYKKYYNSAVKKCYYNDTKLCYPLDKFMRFYKKNIPSKLHICLGKVLPILPNFVTCQPTDEKKYIGKIAYLLYILLNGQTKGELFIISRANYTNLIKLLAINYNMPFYSNNEEKWENIMKILYEFIKFCKENSKITYSNSFIKKNFKDVYTEEKGITPFLNSFIEKFFQDFYEKEKGEYEMMHEY